MDFALPSMNGAVAARRIRNALSRCESSDPEHAFGGLDYVRTCLEAGARGYLLKNAMDLELVEAVRKLAAGEQVLDPRLGRLAASADPCAFVDHA